MESNPQIDGEADVSPGAAANMVKAPPLGPVQQAGAIRRNVSADSEGLREKPSLSMVGLLLLTMIIGYEWLVSGVAKVVRGGFPSGLAKEMLDKSEGVAAWYATLIKTTVVPNAVGFGYAIEISEVLAGIVLLVGPFIWLCAWERVSDRVREVILLLMIIAALGATFLTINLHMANGASHPWLIPKSGFDEGVDLDSVLPASQLVIAAVSILFLRRLRRRIPADTATGSPFRHPE
jgi:thiosulfate dehydrogenase [quinone] large subunit